MSYGFYPPQGLIVPDGSITTEKIAELAVTQAKLANGHIGDGQSVALAFGVSRRPSTTRDTWVVVSGHLACTRGVSGYIEVRTDAADPPVTAIGEALGQITAAGIEAQSTIVPFLLAFKVKANHFYAIIDLTGADVLANKTYHYEYPL